MSTELMEQETSQSLLLLANGRRMIERARSIQDVKEIRDQAQAVAAFLKQRDEAIPTINAAIEIKIVAERNMGERLQEMPKHNGDPRSHDVTRLEDLGIEKMQSSRWQSLASIPEDVFESKIQEIKNRDEPLTTAAFLRFANDLKSSPRTDPESLSLDAAISRLNRAVRGVFQLWPVEFRQVMAHQLKELGEELMEFGELRE